MTERKMIYMGLICATALFAIITLFQGFYIVQPGYAAMHQRLGRVISINKIPGLYLSIPYIDSITTIDTKLCILNNETTALSRDLQFVSIGVAINYRISDIESVYRNLGMGFTDSVIHPFAAESIKAIVAKYTAEELIQLRHEAKDRVCEDLKVRLEIHKIDLIEFNFVHVDFSKAFLHSVEDKQIAQQAALMAKNQTSRVQEEAAQTKLRADAEAYSLEVKKKAVTEELISLKKAEAIIKAIEKWDGILPKTVTSAMPFFNVAS